MKGVGAKLRLITRAKLKKRGAKLNLEWAS
jgi:hypothetical protein